MALYSDNEEREKLAKHLQNEYSGYGVGAAVAQANGQPINPYIGITTPELANMLQQEVNQAMGGAGMPYGNMISMLQHGQAAPPGYHMGPPELMMAGRGAPIDEEPLYVNAKQYNRILKRRQARARMEAKLAPARQKASYMHESRHRHAMKRQRGPGGRFLKAEELAALKAAEAAAKGGPKPTGNAAEEPRDADSDSIQSAQPNGKYAEL